VRRSLDWLLWCVQGLLALEFAAVAWAKVSGMPEMVALFATIGVGQWFRYVTGILELTGAILIVVPRTRTIGAALLGAIMLGAIAVHLFLLHVPPTAPVVLFLLSGLVVFGSSSPWAALRSQAGEVRRSAVPRT
jgi:putative oxidoreductase